MTSIRALTLACIAVALAHPIGAQTRKPRPRHPVAPKPPATHVTSGLQAITTPSGLTYVITHRGTGRHPNAGETVLVNYVGSLLNGKKFDSSYDRNEPLAFPIGKARVIKGWDEGIALMGIGDQAILIVPPDLGYGNRDLGNGLIPPNSTMVFVLELVDVRRRACRRFSRRRSRRRNRRGRGAVSRTAVARLRRHLCQRGRAERTRICAARQAPGQRGDRDLEAQRGGVSEVVERVRQSRRGVPGRGRSAASNRELRAVARARPVDRTLPTF